MIPYGRQSVSDADIEAVVEVLRSDFLTTGPEVERFEKTLCDFLGVRHAVAIANGTAALHAACHAAGIGPGDEVITTPLTFAASANAVLYCGGTPVFADIDSISWNIDPQSIRQRITPRTKAIIPVHYTGLPCDMEAVMEIAQAHGLHVIEDGAHVLGAEKDGRVLGCTGDMMTLSFHPVKHITTGEGGAVVTDSDGLAEALRRFRTHGIVRGEAMTAHQDEPWFYEQQGLGYNYRITDFQCALGRSQMERLPSFISRRREIAARYSRAFSEKENLILPAESGTVKSAWHIYVVGLRLEGLKKTRREIFMSLRDRGIGVNVHYIPVYYHPFYRNLGYDKGLCPVAEDLYERILTLPLYPDMTDGDVETVIEAVQETLKAFKR